MIYGFIASGVLLLIAGFCLRISQLHYKLADLNRLVADMCRATDHTDAVCLAEKFAGQHGWKGQQHGE